MKTNIFSFLFILIHWGLTAQTQEKFPIWYNEPAKDWKSALPIGNGRIGGMVFGGVVEDQILLNENTIWCGPPLHVDNPRGPELISQMRRLLFDGKYAEAEALCASEFILYNQSDNQCYQPFGFLRLRYAGMDDPVNYRRTLDYEQAITSVSYEQNGVKFTREAFVSAPDQVLVMRITADKPEQISFSASFDRPFGATAQITDNNRLHIFGQAYNSKEEYKGVKFDGIVHFIAEGGQIKKTGTGIEVVKANTVTIYIAIATDYNLDQPANPLSQDRFKVCEQQIIAATAKSYAEIKANHTADYIALYNRSSLEIDFPDESTSKITIPIDQRIAAVANGAEDPELLLTYYRYCRYVFISASRKGNLPMNLQGIWNPLMAAPWRSNFHLNINFQEAYWFAEQSNLSECHEPFFTLTEKLVPNGKITAQKMLGIKRGFAAGHRTDVWFYTTLTDRNPRWGMYVIGGAWCVQHLMEHYRFTQDREFLKNRAFPVIRETALFFVDWLVADPKTGKLVSGPTASSENAFIAPNGEQCSISMGPAQDQEMIWSTFRDYLDACKILGIENFETIEVKAAFDNLALPEIASDGRLMEWPGEYKETEPGHRHVSHLWGMMPGDRISLEETSELARAVRNSLNYRLTHDYNAQGWSLGWVTCLLSRLKEGDRALDLMSHQYFNKAYPNMFVDAHNQVQVGDMMGTSLAIIELLIQSHTGTIELLPALPAKWKNGKVKGFCARGGFVFDFEWKNGKLTSASVYSRAGGTCNIRYDNKTTKLPTEPGKTYVIPIS